MKLTELQVQTLMSVLPAMQAHANIKKRELDIRLSEDGKSLVVSVAGPLYCTSSWACDEGSEVGGYWCGEQGAQLPTLMCDGVWRYVNMVPLKEEG